MAHANFKRTYKYIDARGVRCTIPANWSGDLPEDVIEKARTGGYLVDDSRTKARDVRAPDYAAMDDAALLDAVASRALEPGDAKTAEELRDLLKKDDAAKAKAKAKGTKKPNRRR